VGRWHEVEEQATSLLCHSPYNEEATLALAEALAMRGDKLGGVKILDTYLEEVGKGPMELRLPASLMRRRIADRMPSTVDDGPADIPLVGREPYLEKLGRLLDDVRGRTPRTVGIQGDPGIGKSRLVSEFLSFVSLQGASFHRITCRSTDTHRSLAIILELIPLLRAMRGAIGSAPESLAFFETLTTKRVNGHKLKPAARVIEAAHAHLDEALLDILEAVTDESPLVIAIEDCQWIDAASASVLQRLVSKLTAQRLLLIFTTRQGGPQYISPLSSFDIQLPELRESESTQLIEHIVQQYGRPIEASYVAWCVKVAEGNPYFLHELAKHWLETGQEHRVPPSLSAVLQQRLARLNPNSLQVLQTCALLENHSTLDNLELILGYRAHDLLRSINELATAGMVSLEATESGLPGASRLQSRHDLLSATALSQLAPAATAYLHRRAARILETHIEERGDASTLWSCAKHWQLAGDVTQAFRLATSCANHLLEAGLPNDAADAFAKALKYTTTDADALAILEGQATAFFQSSRWHSVIETVSHARELKRRLHPTKTGYDELELMLLRAEWQSLNWNDILERSLRFLGADDALPSHRIEAGSMALMMLSFRVNGVTPNEVFRKIAELGVMPDVDRDTLVQATMVFHTNWGAFDEAVAAAFSLVNQHKARNDIGGLFRSLCNASVTFRAAGMFDDAANHLLEALAIAERHHLHLSKSRAIPMLANMSLETGRLDDARKWHKQLEGIPIAPGDTLGHAEVSAIGARIALLDGRCDHALTLVQRDLQSLQNDQVPHRRAYRAALLVAAELGTKGRASRVSLKELEDAHLLSRGNLFQAFASYALFVGLQRAGEKKRASELLNEYLDSYRREPWASPQHILESLQQL
jgi:tetratricopeptide (TPR) repeat protein